MKAKEFWLKVILYGVLCIPLILLAIQIIGCLFEIIIGIFILLGLIVFTYLMIRGVLTLICWIYYAIVGYDEEE